MYLCDGAVVLIMLLDHELCIRHDSDLAQVRHAKHLTAAGDLPELDADLLCRPARNARVDLVEDERRDAVPVGDDGFQRKHDARELTAGRDLGDGLRNLALVRRNQERHSVHALNGELSLVVLHGKDNVRHIQKPQLLRHALHKALCRFLTIGGQDVCLFGDVVQELCFLCFKLRDAVVLALHGVHFCPCAVVKCQQLVKIAEKLLLHGVDSMIAGAELLRLLLVDVDVLRPAGQLLRNILDLNDSRLQALPEFIRIRINVLDVLQKLHHAL